MYGFLKGGVAMDATEAEVIYDDAIAQYRPSVPAEYTIVPDLYGYGTDTRAAYGGAVDPVILHVDTLASGTGNTDSTHGTFGWALAEDYPRVVVFDISGKITGGSGYLYVNNPYISIYGQTAPGYICYNGGLELRAGDVLIQHMAIRGNGLAQIDGIGINALDRYITNVVIDHCSVTGHRDGQVDMYSYDNAPRLTNITVSNTLMGDGTQTEHQYGSLCSGDDLFFVGCMWVHTLMRSPQLAYDSPNLVVANSISYNYDHSVVNIGSYAGKQQGVTYVGNIAIDGNNSGTDHNQIVMIYNKGLPAQSYTTIYMDDNINRGVAVNLPSLSIDNNGLGYTTALTPTLPANFTPIAASVTEASIIANVGARSGNRDSFDANLVDDMENGTGLIKTSTQTLPTYTNTTTAFVPVANPHDMYDANYTNLEHQMHALAAAVE